MSYNYGYNYSYQPQYGNAYVPTAPGGYASAPIYPQQSYGYPQPTYPPVYQNSTYKPVYPQQYGYPQQPVYPQQVQPTYPAPTYAGKPQPVTVNYTQNNNAWSGLTNNSQKPSEYGSYGTVNTLSNRQVIKPVLANINLDEEYKNAMRKYETPEEKEKRLQAEEEEKLRNIEEQDIKNNVSIETIPTEIKDDNNNQVEIDNQEQKNEDNNNNLQYVLPEDNEDIMCAPMICDNGLSEQDINKNSEEVIQTEPELIPIIPSIQDNHEDIDNNYKIEEVPIKKEEENEKAEEDNSVADKKNTEVNVDDLLHY